MISISFFFFFDFFSFIFISWRLITLQYSSGDIHFLILLLNITNDHLSPHQINLFAVGMSQITIKYNNLEKNLIDCENYHTWNEQMFLEM